MWGGMEVLSPASYLSKASGLIEEESRNKRWTQAENKMFENALALYDKDTPDRWQRVAGMIPGKTIGDVIRQYKELEDDVSIIEAGLVPIPPGYNSNDTDYDNYNNIFTPTTAATAATLPFTLEWVNGYGNYGFDELDYNKQNYYYYYYSDGKRGFGGNARPCEQERKKGVPWTEQEHKLFLMGLKKYGKGDWRNISRNFVVTRTPTQVASHAQKYFIRQLSGGGKDKRRASIHDITTVNLDMDLLVESQAPPPDHVDTSNSSSSPPPTLHQEQEQSATILQQQHPNYYPTTLRTNKTTAASFQHCRDRQRQDNYGGAIAPSIGFNANHPAGNTLFVPPPLPTLSYGFDPHANGRKSQLGLQNLQQRYRVDGSQTVGFQNQQQHYPYG